MIVLVWMLVVAVVLLIGLVVRLAVALDRARQQMATVAAAMDRVTRHGGNSV